MRAIAVSFRRAADPALALAVAVTLLACARPAAPPTASAPTGAPAAPIAPAQPPPTAAAPESARVVVGGLGGLIDRILYIAKDKGFLREQGIEIEYVGVTSMVQAAPHLATGQMDVISASTSAGLWNAIARDVSVKIVSDVTVVRGGRRNSLVVMVRKDLADSGAIRDYTDLRGRTFAIHQRAQVNHVEAGRLLALGGLSERDVNLIEVPFPEQVAAFRNGAIDVAIAVEPMVTVMEEQGLAVRWRDMGEIYPGQVVQFLFFSAQFIAERRDVAQRYFLAHVQAARYFDDAFIRGRNRDEVVSILVNNGPVKAPSLFDKIGLSFANTEQNGRVSLDSLADEQEFFLAQGLLTQRIDPAQLVDTSFAAYALSVLGRVED